jgi:hypothetical protein
VPGAVDVCVFDPAPTAYAADDTARLVLALQIQTMGACERHTQRRERVESAALLPSCDSLVCSHLLCDSRRCKMECSIGGSTEHPPRIRPLCAVSHPADARHRALGGA